MKTYNEALREAVESLKGSEVPEPELNAWHLMSWAVALCNEEKAVDNSRTTEIEADPHFVMRMVRSAPDRVWFMLNGDEEISDELDKRYSTLVGYRKKRVPLEYIIHYTEFMGLPFYVEPSVLIPRQDTECLVEKTLEICKKDYPNGEASVLDMCTGSGCIAVSLAKLGDFLSVTATDKSKEAIRCAQINADLNGVDIRLFKGDMWDALKKCPDEKFDIIVSNPPYIRREVIDTLMDEVKYYEPSMALNGGEDGLYFYRKIAVGAGTFLKKDGWLICEIGYDQAEDVSVIFRGNGFSDIEIIKDIPGNDRVVMCRRR